MNQYLNNMKNYWDERFAKEGKIWGETPSKTAVHAIELFKKHNVKRILVPGAGYGRHTKLFSDAGFEVVGVEISEIAVGLAKEYDRLTKFYNVSFLGTNFDNETYDAVYCYNVLHLFLENERKLFIKKCNYKLKDRGYLFFTVFSDKEHSFGNGKKIEKNTFESKPGRPVHYFTEDDLLSHFMGFYIIETGIIEDIENHGEEGTHTHILRYIWGNKPTF